MSKFILILLLLCSNAYAAEVVIYDPTHPVVPNIVVDYLKSANTPDYEGQPNTLINPDLSGLLTTSWKYNKSLSVLEDLTQADLDAIEDYEEDLQKAYAKQSAKDSLGAFNQEGLKEMAILEVLIDLQIIKITYPQVEALIKAKIDAKSN